jgi:hypothetical protein
MTELQGQVGDVRGSLNLRSMIARSIQLSSRGLEASALYVYVVDDVDTAGPWHTNSRGIIP